MKKALQEIIQQLTKDSSQKFSDYSLTLEQCHIVKKSPEFQDFSPKEKSALYYIKTYAFMCRWRHHKAKYEALEQPNPAGASPFIEQARKAVVEITKEFNPEKFKLKRSTFNLPKISPEDLYSLVVYTEDIKKQVFNTNIYQVIIGNEHLNGYLKFNDTLYQQLKSKYLKQCSSPQSDSTAKILDAINKQDSAIIPGTTKQEKKKEEMEQPLLGAEPDESPSKSSDSELDDDSLYEYSDTSDTDTEELQQKRRRVCCRIL